MTALIALSPSQQGEKAFWGHSAGIAGPNLRLSAPKLMNPDHSLSLPYILVASCRLVSSLLLNLVLLFWYDQICADCSKLARPMCLRSICGRVGSECPLVDHPLGSPGT